MMLLPFVLGEAQGAASSLSSRTTEPGRVCTTSSDQGTLMLGHRRMSEREQPHPGCQGFNGDQL